MKITHVNEYIDAHPDWKSILSILHRLILSSGLEATIKWGAPVYSLAGKNVVGLAAFKSYAGLWFFNGGLLDDHAKVLINAQPGKTQAMRQWRFPQNAELDERLILDYIKAAIENQQKGLAVKPKKAKAVSVPQELSQQFNQAPELQKQFSQLNPSKQREYAEYINAAKRATTINSRLEKIIPMIEQGIGLNDKYR